MKRSLALALAACVTLAACSKVGQTNTNGEINATTQPHWLRIADGSGDIPTLNPDLYTEATIGYISELTMAYFVRYDAKGEPYPELLTVIPTQKNGGISKDGKTITWHLRHGVRWSDGAPFTADDVVFSTKAVLNPANNVVGRDGWDLITKIDEPDKFTVVYHLKKPYGPYLPTFFGSAGANPCILPAHLLAKYPNINHVAYNSKPVGIGPFRVTQWRRGDAIEMEANPYYWRGTPKLKRITYKLIPDRNTLLTALQTGDVDLAPKASLSLVDQLRAIKSANVVDKPSTDYALLSFVVTRPLLTDVRVREAIRYAVDRESILRDIYHGEGQLGESILPPSNPLAPRLPLIPYDPSKAIALLQQAGWTTVGPDGIRTKNGRKLTLRFVAFTGSPALDQEIEIMRQGFLKVGIGLDVHKYSVGIFFGAVQDGGIVYGSKYDMTAFSWVGQPGADYSTIYESNQVPPKGQNAMHYKDAQADRWMEQIKATYDEPTQKALLAKLIPQIVKDVPIVVMYYPNNIFVENKDLKGYTPGTFTYFDNMMNVDV